ncbi:MAG: pilus assembly protein N-terminal domain-containing protein [Pirellulales bacterium]|nr:pilus assembly protein N-terminal domain-containing protein [Pirellulales bacterium]
MYDNQLPPARFSRATILSSATILFAFAAWLAGVARCGAQLPVISDGPGSESVIRKISSQSERLELTTNSSRILTLEKNIPRVQVNNPELLAVTPLSATQVQVSAKKAGVTQVNLWDEEGNIHSVDVQIYGDARELSLALQTQFPHSSIKVYRYSESLVLTGFVDRPDHVGPIMRLAEDYAPKVINNINVGGVQQILLKVKVMEISRTKLRRLSTDFAFLDSSGSFFSTGVSGLLNQTSNVASAGFQTVTDTAGKAAEFGVVGSDAAFFGFIDWLQQNNVAKVLADPNITAISGRPAQFNVGGEIPIVVPQSLGTASIEYKPYGTQVDFLPIVLGNGNIRLEVRPRISELDDSRSVIIQDYIIPSLTVRQVDTAVEMKAGQTFALAGLVQERTKSIKRGLPYISDMPVLGIPFRKTQDEVNEIELLIVVTPEFVDPIDAGEMPCNGPGTFSTSPSTCDMYVGGVIEVPTHCNPTQGLGACGQNPCGNPNCNNCNNGGCQPCGPNGSTQGRPVPSNPFQGEVIHDRAVPEATEPMPMRTTLPGGTGYDDSPTSSSAPMPVEIQDGMPPRLSSARRTAPAGQAAGSRGMAVGQVGQAHRPVYMAAQPHAPQRQPVFTRDTSKPYTPQAPSPASRLPSVAAGVIGGVGYDAE